MGKFCRALSELQRGLMIFTLFVTFSAVIGAPFVRIIKYEHPEPIQIIEHIQPREPPQQIFVFHDLTEEIEELEPTELPLMDLETEKPDDEFEVELATEKPISAIVIERETEKPISAIVIERETEKPDTELILELQAPSGSSEISDYQTELPNEWELETELPNDWEPLNFMNE